MKSSTIITVLAYTAAVMGAAIPGPIVKADAVYRYVNHDLQVLGSFHVRERRANFQNRSKNEGIWGKREAEPIVKADAVYRCVLVLEFL